MHNGARARGLTMLAGIALAASVVLSVLPARAQDIPLDKQRGVRGRVIVAPELLSGAPVWPVSAERDKALRAQAIVRRPLGRPIAPILDVAPPLVVMLEGPGIRQESVDIPVLRVEGMRFVPSSAVLPRAGAVKIVNKQHAAIDVVDGDGRVVAKAIAPGESADVTLAAGGSRVLGVADSPARAVVRVLERGRVLPIRNNEIPLTDIGGGEYTLTFFLGAEPLRIQPLTVADGGLTFIDATVSAKGVVDISVKDALARVAVPPSLPGGDGSP
jgi:hypothetical protein